MTYEDLKIIHDAWAQMEGGISNPIAINKAYESLPNHIIGTGAPMVAKIRAITRFMMLQYEDEMKQVQKSKTVPYAKDQDTTETNVPVDSPSVSPSKTSTPNEDLLPQDFLTKKEKEKLAGSSGTKLVGRGRPSRNK